MHQRRFPAAGWTDDRDKFSALNIQGHIVQRPNLFFPEPVDFADVTKFDECHGKWTGRFPSLLGSQLSLPRRLRRPSDELPFRDESPPGGDGARPAAFVPEAGETAALPFSPRPGRLPASWRAFFSRSSLGNSSETISPSARPFCTSA